TGPVRSRARLHLRHPGRAHRHNHSIERHARSGHRLPGSRNASKLARRDLRRPRKGPRMNIHAIRAIYGHEMDRWRRTMIQSVISPVLSTSLYFVVFGAAIGGRIAAIDGVPYGAFLVPGLIMLMLLTESTSNAAFGIYFPRFTGTTYELL